MKFSRAYIIGLIVLLIGSFVFNLYQLSTRTNFGAAQQAGQELTGAVTAQVAALCEVAKEHLREHWTENKTNIHKVIQVVNNTAEMEAKMKTDLAEMSQALQLTPEQLASFSVKYQSTFFPHVNRFREHLNSKNPDWPGMFGTLKEFYSSEDKLVFESFGKDGLEKFRQSQIKKRTTMLALIGQYAEVPWDANIIW